MGKKTKAFHPERLDDYIIMGKYVFFVCIASELFILPLVSSMFYMIYAGAAPRLLSCDGHVFDTQLEGKEICFEIQDSSNCTNPEFKYQFKSVNVEWTYFCTTSKHVKNSISIQMVGVLTGSMVFGQVSDSFGRKIAAQVAVIGMLISWLIVAQSTDLLQFTVTRTIVGFFTGGCTSVINVFVLENLPKAQRMWIYMLISWSPNIPITSFLAWVAGDWMTLAYINALLCIPAFLFFQFVLHESTRWHITKGNLDEAKRLFHRQLKISNQEHLINEKFNNILEDEYTSSVKQNRNKQQYSYYHLFVTPTLGKYVILLAFSYCATSVISYGVLFNMEKLSGSIYLNTVYIGLMRYTCSIIFGYADLKIKKVGRKFLHTSGLAVILVSLSFVVFCYTFHFNHEMKDFIRMAILIANSMTPQVVISNGIVGNELFPTPVRNLGYSFLQLWNRFGVVMSPFVFYLADYWIALPFCVMLFFSTIDLFCFQCLLPETKGKPLVEHMPPRDQWLFSGSQVEEDKEEVGEDVEFLSI